MNTIGTIPQLPALPSKPQAPAVKTGDAYPIKPVAEPQLPVPVRSEVPDTKAFDQQRLAKIREAASNFYAVSDRKFTIFKDSSGQYITRFTSLRDGSVTYMPEPDLLKSAPVSSGSALSIKA